MWPREADGGFRGGNQQSGPTTSDMPEPFTDPSGDGMEWLCKPAASEDNVCGWFTGCQSGPSKVLTLLTHRAARDAESKKSGFVFARATVCSYNPRMATNEAALRELEVI